RRRRRRGAADPRAPEGAACGAVLPRRAASPQAGGRPGPRPHGLREPVGGGGAMKKTETKSTGLLKHHLKALRLPTMTAECEKVARRCAAEDVDHLGFLLQLCELELIERERRAAQRRLKAARFPTVKTLESFDFAAAPALN